MADTYYAHRNAEGDLQTVEEHLDNVARMAEKMADAFGYGNLGYCAGKVHDYGKCSEEFQMRLLENGRKVDHSTAGAVISEKQWGGTGFLIGMPAAGHHSGLMDFGSKADTADAGTYRARLKKKIPGYSEPAPDFQLPGKLQIPIPQFQSREEQNLFLSFLIRMVYSCLVDADFLDTEKFMNPEKTERYAGLDIRELKEKFDAYINDKGYLVSQGKSLLNQDRSRILSQCLEKGKQKPGCFRLTVPTGGGKTIASLGFALQHAISNNLMRIIYVIPYTSIIDQTALCFESIFGKDNVLEHYSAVTPAPGDELNVLELAAENWDFSLILTTSVQFFESLYSNRASKSRKIHNMAESVIIFDEIQTFPTDYLQPALESIQQLLSFCHSSVVFCTATQPQFDPFLRLSDPVQEIIENYGEYFRHLRRVTYRYQEELDLDQLVSQICEDDQVLIVMNTRKKARELYYRIRSIRTDIPVFYLSTWITSSQRRKILQKAEEYTDADQPCILVSTNLIEAGVQLDFRKAYRDLCGLDSVLQTAGRCNREGKYDPDQSIVTVFKLDEPEGNQELILRQNLTRQLLLEKEEIDSPETAEEYFTQLLYYLKQNLDVRDILGCFRAGLPKFKTAAEKFRLIDDGPEIYIPLEKRAAALLEQYRNGNRSRTILRNMAQYTVSVSQTDRTRLLKNGKISELGEDIENYYVLEDLSIYDREAGLLIE